MADGSRTFQTDPADHTPRLAAVYRAHAVYVWRVLRHLGVPDDDLDDAVQETFLVVSRRLAEFEGKASLRTWLYAVAVRVASTQRRSQRREVARRERAGVMVHGESRIDPEAELGRAEAARLLDALLDELDTAKRTVFVLAEIEGVKVPEISRILGVNVRTVHSRLRLARARFGAAVRRVQAQEEGRERLRARMLVRRGAEDGQPPARTQAVFAAVVARVGAGDVPGLVGWQGVSLVASPVWVVPACVVGVVGIVAVAWGVARPNTDGRSAGSIDTVAVSEVGPSAAIVDAPRPAEPPVMPMAPLRVPVTVAASARPIRAPAVEPPSPSPSPSSLEVQTAHLEAARGALRRNDPAAALVELDRMDAGFPDGELRDAGDSTRLLAYCAAGRNADAHVLAERLAAGRTDSRWHAIVAANCE